ncbi:MAG: FAD-binding protein, partial [Eggerthellaceae bacterium]|nr:FAD-binding protein [Eggerthellaceae bacterium]
MEQLSRRNFLKLGGAMAAGAALPLVGCSQSGNASSGAASSAAVSSADASSSAVAVEAESKDINYDFAADVVVIGSGAGGLMACVGAHEAGATSLLIEKNTYVGGDSLVCHQDILAFWPERTMADAGFEDTRESYLEDWIATHEYSSLKGIQGQPMPESFPHIERYVDIFRETGNWLVEEAGVELVPVILGSSLATRYSVEPRTWHADIPVVTSVLNKLETFDDVTILTSMQGISLMQDESGKVCGVRMCTDDGTVYAARANKGVVIATGSFCGNQFMVSHYIKHEYSQVVSYGTVAATGDGHRMAMEIGANTVDLDLGLNWNVCWLGTDNYWNTNNHLGKFGDMEGALAPRDPAIFVNRNGKRYANELLGYNGMGRNTCEQPDRMGFYIFDSAIHDQELLDCGAIVLSADSIEELAGKIGVDPAALRETVDRYNGFVDAGEDTDFGKNVEGCTRIETAPFYALTIVPRPYVTLGGLATDADSRVLDKSGSPIPGLYAAGIVCGSYAEQDGLLYYGGFGQALAFGMQAGR